MSKAQDTETETETESDASTGTDRPRDTNGQFASDDAAGAPVGEPGPESDAQDAQDASDERDDQHVTVTFALDNPTSAELAFLRDNDVPVEAVLQNELGRDAEEVIHEAKQTAKYQRQDQRQGGQQRRQPPVRRE